MLNILSCDSWPSKWGLWRNVHLALLPIFFMDCLLWCSWASWVVCKFCRLIPYLSHYFANIFFHTVGCLFILLTVLLLCNILSLIKSHFFIVVFISSVLGGISEKVLWQFMSYGVLAIFSSRSFLASGFTFRYLIHFELIFVYGVKNNLVSFFKHMKVKLK